MPLASMPDSSASTPALRQSLAWVAVVSAFAGLLFSKFLLSCAMWLLLGLGLTTPKPREAWQRLVQQPAYWGSVGLFLLFWGSALVSDNLFVASARLRLALPLLALPLAFAALPPFTKRQFQYLLLIYIYAVALAGLGVLVNYLWNYEAMQELLRVSKAIPTPNKQHIRFSLMVDLALLWALWLWGSTAVGQQRGHRWFLPLVALFLFVLQHVLSVRIGLVIAYAGLGVWGVIWLWQQKRYKTLGLGGLALVILPFLAYQWVPSIQTKVNLTRYNWQLYQRGEIGAYSDTRRLLSYQVGWEVAQQSPWLGVGLGDLNDEQAAIYSQDYPTQPVMYPHNMFLTVYAGMGRMGLGLFLLFFYGPLWWKRNDRHLGWLLFYVVMTLSFLTENTLFTSIGVGIYSLFNGLLVQQLPIDPNDTAVP